MAERYKLVSPSEAFRVRENGRSTLLRETTFRVGGALMVALGVLLGYGLYTAGVGAEFYDAWLSVPLSVVLGAFFLYVAHSEGKERRAFLRTSLGPPPPGPDR